MTEDYTCLTPSGLEPNRSARAQRASVMLSATVRSEAGAIPTLHRVRDISTGGMRIDGASSLKPGLTVLVSVGAIENVDATVKWVRQDFAGLAFSIDIDPLDARKKAALGGVPPANPAPVPTAGWVGDMLNPYRK